MPIKLVFFDGERECIELLYNEKGKDTLITRELLVSTFDQLTACQNNILLNPVYVVSGKPPVRMRVVGEIDEAYQFSAKEDMIEFAFGWGCICNLRNFDTGFTSQALKRKVIQSLKYRSNIDFKENFTSLFMLTKEGRYKLVFDVDGKAIPLTVESFFEFFKYARECNCYLMSLKDCYSALTIPQVETRITFIQGKVEEKVTGTKREISGQTKIKTLSAMISDIPSSTDANLRQQFIQQVNGKGQAREWNAVVDHTVRSMTYLHQAYHPSTELNEAARRLIINNIVIPVCAFLGIRFTVETLNGGELGQGPLDFQFHGRASPVVGKINMESTDEIEVQMIIDYTKKSAAERSLLSKEEVVGMAEIEERNIHSSSLSVIGKETSEDANKAIAGELRVIEAKEEFEDRGLAQLAAQMYDLLITQSAPVVLGILCTGTTWLFFNMDLEVATSNSFSQKNATMRCLAKGALRIIKDPTPATGPKKRRSSATASETVSENEVRHLLELFAAFINST